MSAASPAASVDTQGQAPSAPLLLEARSVSKSFWGRSGFLRRGAENRALDDVSIRVAPGEILGLVGESGCGKSTLAKVLLGLERADAGSLAVGGKTLFAPGEVTVPAAGRGIQMIFQDPYGSLNPRMKVGDLIGEGLRIQGRMSRGDIADEVRRHLALVGLSEDSLGKYAHQFSGGQRQRLCIARAIIMKPKLLIADEAASALDVSVQMQILNLLLDLRDRIGLGVIFISHDMGVIEYLCDRIAVMYRGRVVEEGAAAAVLDRPRHPYTAHLIAARPRVGVQRRKAPETDALVDPLAAPLSAGELAGRCVYAERCDRALDVCVRQRPELEGADDVRVACFNPIGG
ncbi:MAG: ATP-binding cassette domain-containing protein [Beijerinckiaceae bacterium]|nr:ATP-binding cassette domain-containing protein [Beijerinckiaceae bacterium]